MSGKFTNVAEVWSRITLYVGFHKTPQGKPRNRPFAWRPENATATLPTCDDTEVFLVLEGSSDEVPNDVQVRCTREAIALARHGRESDGWSGVIVQEDAVAVKVAGTWLKILSDGSVIKANDP
jgi:hypothetical protein